MQVVKGMIVKSIAGHDKDRFYLVLRLQDGFAWIADGKRRKRETPKKKNVRHLRPTGRVVDPEEYPTDRSLRALLHSYNSA